MDEVEYDEVRRRQPETPVRRSVQLEGRSTRAREDERRSRSRTRHEGRRGSTHPLRSRSRSTRGAGGGRLRRSRSRRRESYDDDDLRQKLRLLEDQLLKRNEQRRRDEATTNYRRSTSQARKIYTPPRSDARSPEHKKPTYSDQDKSKSVFEVLVNDDEDDKYEIVIKVNGLHTPCQVDLGSQATLIRKMDADKLGLVYESVQGPMLRGLGNIPYLPIGKVFVCIEVQDVKEEQVEAYIVDSSLINMQVLLGHNFTERPGLRIVKTASDLEREKSKDRFDKHRKVATKYKIDDLVRVIKNVIGGTGKSKKLEPKCQGPYRIKSVLPNDRYLIVDTPITRKGRPYENVVSVDKIFPWMNFDAPACSSSDDSDN
ncbi:hypothetical protein HF086_003704 [Spodoptera exigua]|uniref:Uncharacterized protein n=1 Tax=Spodoptera exigua TaxID=7107 RepID=A0A922M278_SPOEX|nr:hypothetical protein HF086_003704 [Spodoptera exigua]